MLDRTCFLHNQPAVNHTCLGKLLIAIEHECVPIEKFTVFWILVEQKFSRLERLRRMLGVHTDYASGREFTTRIAVRLLQSVLELLETIF